jgi:hypothetical protein
VRAGGMESRSGRESNSGEERSEREGGKVCAVKHNRIGY